jgi:hypothetical protein
MSDEIIDLERERTARRNDLYAELYQRIQDLCTQFLDEDHDSDIVIDALLHLVWELLYDGNDESPKFIKKKFIKRATDIEKTLLTSYVRRTMPISIRGDRLQKLLRKEITLEELTRNEREAAEGFLQITADRKSEGEDDVEVNE